TLNGLHIHNAPVGVDGPVLIDSGIGGGASSVTDDDGAGVLFRRASIAPGSTDALGALDAMSKNPELFYVNLHSTIHPGGAVRAQLASNVYHFAQAGGGGGSSTALSLTNPSATASASGFAYFFGADGKPLDTVVNNAAVPFLIPPSGTVTLSTNSRSAVKSGYARVVSPDIVIPGFTFSVPGYAAASGEASTQDAFAFRAAVSRDGSGVNEAGVAVVNVSDQPVRVVLTLTSSGIARPAGRTTVILAPGEQISRFLGELFPGVGNFSGLLRIVGLTPFPSKTLIATVVQLTATQASVVPLTRATKVEEVAEEN
ncbi:MAG: CHRD domain-containing protein, partial [Acidobacteria bacterium]|nr:CHRD domain-containing protein [Acidobacteriota bacterium]